jgi:chemotaxis protein MotB
MSKRHQHHGGAWKVAYADFTTAMMALFLVLWLTAQDTRIKEAVERAFTNPFKSITKESVGIIPNKDSEALHKSKGTFDSPTSFEMELLRRISDDLAKLLQQKLDDPDTPVKLELTPEGLRINVFDRASRPVFQPDTAAFTEYGGWVFSTLAWELARYPKFTLELEGHTEAGRTMPKPEYTVWELSSDRANAARRKLLDNGVRLAQINKVAGFGDVKPMTGTDPAAPVNRRVTVLLQKPADTPAEALSTASVSPP